MRSEVNTGVSISLLFNDAKQSGNKVISAAIAVDLATKGQIKECRKIVEI